MNQIYTTSPGCCLKQTSVTWCVHSTPVYQTIRTKTYHGCHREYNLQGAGDAELAPPPAEAYYPGPWLLGSHQQALVWGVKRRAGNGHQRPNFLQQISIPSNGYPKLERRRKPSSGVALAVHRTAELHCHCGPQEPRLQWPTRSRGMLGIQQRHTPKGLFSRKASCCLQGDSLQTKFYSL